MQFTKKLTNYILALFIVFSNLSFKNISSETKGNLKVVVNKINNNKGQIGFCLFKSGTGFPNHPESAYMKAFVKTNNNATEYTFINIETGTYAVSAFHDENSDQNLGSNWIGIPNEGIGVSNNAEGSFGPPKFNDAKFTFDKSEQTITISLKYL